KDSFRRRTTGASIVEDAERTNSPISLSLARTALLSTPNSLASSYTRTFATTLLQLRSGTGHVPDRCQLELLIAAYSSGAHPNLDLLPHRYTTMAGPVCPHSPVDRPS